MIKALHFIISILLVSLIFYRYIAVNNDIARYRKINSFILRVEPPFEALETKKGIRILYGIFDIILPEEHQAKRNIVIIMSCKHSIGEGKLTDNNFTRIRLICSLKDTYDVEVNSGKYIVSVFMAFLTDFRAKMLDFCFTLLPEPQASLLAGILLGYRASLSPDFYQMLIDVGVVHVIAASGYNVTWVSSAIQLFLKRFLPVRICTICSIFTVFCYCACSGFSASVVRASIMSVLFLLSAWLGKKYSASLALWYAVLLMIVIDPLHITSLSFQLSVFSTLGLLYIVPVLRIKKWITLPQSLLEEFYVTTAASISTMPILLYAFGRLSIISILANLTLLWIVPIVMVLGMIFLVVSVISRLFAGILAIIIYVFLEYFITGVRLFASLPFASLELPKIPLWLVIVSEVAVFSYCLRVMRKNTRECFTVIMPEKSR